MTYDDQMEILWDKLNTEPRPVREFRDEQQEADWRVTVMREHDAELAQQDLVAGRG